MSIDIAQQTSMFFYALLLGAAIGALYDIFRVTRIAFRLSWLLILLEDALFFLLSAVLLWRYFLEQSGGEFRIFAVIGVLLGWLLYYLTLGCLVMRLSGFIIGVITRIITVILVPVGKIYTIIKKYLRGTQKLINSGIIRLKSLLSLLYNKSKRPRVRKQHNGRE